MRSKLIKAGYCCLLALVCCLAGARGIAQEQATPQTDATREVVRLKRTLAAGGVEWFTVSPTDQLVALSYAEHYIQIWDARTGEFLRALPRFKVLPHVTWSPDGRQLLLYDFIGKKVSVWNAATGTQVCELKGLRHDLTAEGAQWSPDGRLILTQAEDAGFKASWLEKEKTELQFWDAATCQPRAPAIIVRYTSPEAKFSPDGRQLLTYGVSEEARLWDVQTGQLQATLRPAKHYYQDDTAPRAEFLPGTGFVLVSNHLRGVSLWEAATGKLQSIIVARTPPDYDYVLCGVSPDGKLLAIYREHFKSLKSLKLESTIELRDSLTGQLRTTLTGHNMRWAVNQVLWSGDGQTLITAGGNREYNGKIWDAHTGQLKATFQMLAKEGRVPFTNYWADLDHLSLHPNQPLLMAASNHLTRLLNPANGELLQQLDGAGYPAAWSTDGQMLFTLNRKQKAVQVWSLCNQGC